MILRTFVSALAVVSLSAVSSAAITFGNFVYDPAIFPLAPVVSGNALTWFPSDAATVGDVSAFRGLTFVFAYDATSTVPLVSLSSLGQSFTLGTGVVSFTQTVSALDAGGNVVGTLGTVNTGASSSTLTFSQAASRIRVVNAYTLSAPDGVGFDFAGVSLINQNLSAVPGPSAFLPFALGALAMRRRKARS